MTYGRKFFTSVYTIIKTRRFSVMLVTVAAALAGWPVILTGWPAGWPGDGGRGRRGRGHHPAADA